MKTRTSILGAICAVALLPATVLGATPAVSVEDAESMAATSLDAALVDLENLGPSPETDIRSTLALGVVQYRLGDIDDAKETFESLLGTAEEHRANYYLAAIAEAGGDYDRAKTLYESAADQYQDLIAQERADNALFALSFGDWPSHPTPRISDRAFTYVSGKVKGVNGLIDPDDTAVVDTSDVAFDVMLAGSMSIWSPNELTNWRIGANLFREDYADYSDYDLQMIGISTHLQRVLGRNLINLHLGLSDVSLGGQDYLGYTDFGLTNTLTLNDDWDFRISGLYRDVTSNSSEYDYYEGSTIRAALEFRGRDSNPWRFDYTYRNDDAADRFLQFTNDDGEVLDGFLSYSRDYHRIRGRYDIGWSDRLRQTFSASLRSTVYDDPNLYLESTSDTALTETIRKGFRYAIGSELSWSINDRIRLLGEIEYFDENSNIDTYDFDSMHLGIGLDYLF